MKYHAEVTACTRVACQLPYGLTTRSLHSARIPVHLGFRLLHLSSNARCPIAAQLAIAGLRGHADGALCRISDQAAAHTFHPAVCSRSYAGDTLSGTVDIRLICAESNVHESLSKLRHGAIVERQSRHLLLTDWRSGSGQSCSSGNLSYLKMACSRRKSRKS